MTRLGNQQRPVEPRSGASTFARLFETSATWVERHERPLIIVLIAAAVAVRAIYCLLRSVGSIAGGEALRVASAVGEGRGFADAYRVGQGATAHLLPISPGIAGLVYRIFGISSPAAETVLFCWAVGLMAGTFLFLYRAFGRLGVPVWARLAGLAYCCLAPAYFGQESSDFRVWDGGLASFLAAWMLDRTVLAEVTGGVETRAAVALAALGALLFFVNPSVGLAYLTSAGIVVLRRLPPRRWWAPVATGIIVGALLIGPWAIRNQRVLGEPVLLRSNAGLELAMGLHAGELHAADRKQDFMTRIYTIHPSFNEQAYRDMAASGEIAYARRMGTETRAWVARHPSETAALMLLHIRQTVAPQAWEFGTFGSGGGTYMRAVLSQIAGVFGVIGLAVALIRRQRGWWCPSLSLAVLLVLGAPFQPVKRYTYLVYPTLVFAAASLLGQVERGSRRRPSPALDREVHA